MTVRNIMTRIFKWLRTSAATSRRQKLADELPVRDEEIAGYRLNIDRYERMLAAIAAMPPDAPETAGLRDYAEQRLKPLLDGERANLALIELTRDTIVEMLAQEAG
jgi:hypothetical protein